MRQLLKLPRCLLSLLLAPGVVCAVVALVGSPLAFAQATTRPVPVPPSSAYSVSSSGPSPVVPGSLPIMASAPGTRNGDRRATRHLAPGLSSSDRWEALRNEVVAPGLLVGSLAIGLSDHLTGEPAAWRGGATGYAMRAGSTAGRLLLEAGATHGIAAATQLDPRFIPRQTGGVGPRLRHAVLAAVTARTASGVRVPNVPRLTGTYGAALAEQRWASGETRFGDAALTLALSLGIDVAVNVVLEFAASK